MSKNNVRLTDAELSLIEFLRRKDTELNAYHLSFDLEYLAKESLKYAAKLENYADENDPNFPDTPENLLKRAAAQKQKSIECLQLSSILRYY